MKYLAIATAMVLSTPALAAHYSDRPYTHAERTLIAKADRALLSHLRDPYSAHIILATTYQHSAAVCGIFNAKNSFGAYVGKTLFLYVTATRQVFIGQVSVPPTPEEYRAHRMITRYCHNG